MPTLSCGIYACVVTVRQMSLLSCGIYACTVTVRQMPTLVCGMCCGSKANAYTVLWNYWSDGGLLTDWAFVWLSYLLRFTVGAHRDCFVLPQLILALPTVMSLFRRLFRRRALPMCGCSRTWGYRSCTIPVGLVRTTTGCCKALPC